MNIIQKNAKCLQMHLMMTMLINNIRPAHILFLLFCITTCVGCMSLKERHDEYLLDWERAYLWEKYYFPKEDYLPIISHYWQMDSLGLNGFRKAAIIRGLFKGWTTNDLIRYLGSPSYIEQWYSSSRWYYPIKFNYTQKYLEIGRAHV